MRVFRFLLHLHPELPRAPRTLDGMLTYLAGQAQDRAALGAGAEDVGGGVGREDGLFLSLETGKETEPDLILPPSLGNITGEEAEHGPDEHSQSQEVEADRDHR